MSETSLNTAYDSSSGPTVNPASLRVYHALWCDMGIIQPDTDITARPGKTIYVAPSTDLEDFVKNMRDHSVQVVWCAKFKEHCAKILSEQDFYGNATAEDKEGYADDLQKIMQRKVEADRDQYTMPTTNNSSGTGSDA